MDPVAVGPLVGWLVGWLAGWLAGWQRSHPILLSSEGGIKWSIVIKTSRFCQKRRMIMILNHHLKFEH